MDGEWSTQGSKRGKQQQAFVPQATNADLKDSDKNAFRDKARVLARSVFDAWRSRSGEADNLEKTMCLMFYKDSAGQLKYVQHTSGFPENMKGKLTALRKTAGVVHKDTVCAEERLLCTLPHTVPKESLLFSAAYDQMGAKQACCNCALCLNLYGIEDLH